jgi:hypothetical protein
MYTQVSTQVSYLYRLLKNSLSGKNLIRFFSLFDKMPFNGQSQSSFKNLEPILASLKPGDYIGKVENEGGNPSGTSGNSSTSLSLFSHSMDFPPI